MKKIINIRNIGLVVILVLISVIVLNTKEVKATGTTTWNGPSSITIRETIHNMTNTIAATRQYDLFMEGTQDASAIATITYTRSDVITNNELSKTTVMNLSNLTFTKPGDYNFYLNPSALLDSDVDYFSVLDTYFRATTDQILSGYIVVVQVRNVVDANNVPTGNFTATLMVEYCTADPTTYELSCEKISPVSGVLYVDFDMETNPEKFGHIEISKTVKGIGADTNEYFPMTITINNDPSQGGYVLSTSGWSYPISGIDATITYNGNTINNPTTITVGTPTTIYLKHGQTAIVGQTTSGNDTLNVIPIGKCNKDNIEPAKNNPSNFPKVKKLAVIDGDVCYGSYFNVEESPGSYTPIFFVNGKGSSGYFVPANSVTHSPKTVDFVNTKEMSPVTGLIFTILPYLILAGIGVGGTLLIMHLKKQKVDA